MFCPKCGQEMPDGSKFCKACGAPLAASAPNPVASPNTNNVATSQIPTNTPTSATPNGPTGMANGPAFGAPGSGNMPNAPTPAKKKVNTKLIGISAAVVVVVVAAIIGIISLFSGSGNDAYVYLSDGKYELMTNLNKENTIEIASTKSTLISTFLVKFSPDGKYVYFFTKPDEYSGTGTLNRAEFGKLKENSAKNDQYIEIIATNVYPNYDFLPDGTIVYRNGDDTLYYYNGMEATQIAKNVNYYSVDESNRIIYQTGDYDEGYVLYGISLKDLDNKIKLASNYDYSLGYDDLDNILYIKSDDDGNQSLYVVGFEKSAEKLADNVRIINYGEDDLYFTSSTGESLSLYDYVDDSYADADKGISEPTTEEYSVPVYRYELVYGNNISEGDYEELYTSCTRGVYFYGESTWWTYSMEDSIKRNFGDNSDAIHTATQKFIDKYASTADEDGYIKVTDEVKAALKEIQTAAGKTGNEWLWLCFNKYQYGLDTDYSAYYAAQDEWYKVADRIELRERLQDKENNFPVKTLYRFEKNGTLTPIAENVLNTRTFNGAIMYNTPDQVTKKVKIEEMYSIDEARSALNLDPEADNPLVITLTGEVSSLVIDDVFSGNNYYTNGLLFTEKEVFLNDSDGSLSVAPINNGVIGDFKLITDDVDSVGMLNSKVYYVTEPYSSNGAEYYDLYAYENGTPVRVARDIMEGHLSLYEDNVILAFTGYRRGSGYELTMFNAKGESTLIADDVTQYIRVDESTLLYISDDDLYVFNGKEKTRIRTDVDMIWSKNAMESVAGVNEQEYWNDSYFSSNGSSSDSY